MVDFKTSCAKWRRFGAVTSLLVVCEAWAAVGGVTVTAIGYDVSPPVISMAWLDNKRLLFAGAKANADPKKVSFSPTKIYIWDDDSKNARTYAEDALERRFCYSDDYISYIVRADKANRRAVFREGKIGQEKEVERPLGVPRVHSPFVCGFKKLEEVNPPIPKDRRYLVLREGHGYLSLEPTGTQGEYWQHPRNITLYRERGALPVTLPITWDEGIYVDSVSYSESLKAYLISPSKFLSTKYSSPIPGEKGPGPWPKDEPRVVYRLDPETGKVERLVYPEYKGGWPVRGGRVYTSGDPYTVGSLALYADIGGQISRIDTGQLRALKVSSDGCKVAIAIDNGYLKERSSPSTIKLINFCTGRKS